MPPSVSLCLLRPVYTIGYPRVLVRRRKLCANLGKGTLRCLDCINLYMMSLGELVHIQLTASIIIDGSSLNCARSSSRPRPPLVCFISAVCAGRGPHAAQKAYRRHGGLGRDGPRPGRPPPDAREESQGEERLLRLGRRLQIRAARRPARRFSTAPTELGWGVASLVCARSL